jgi:hypothetical protein
LIWPKLDDPYKSGLSKAKHEYKGEDDNTHGHCEAYQEENLHVASDIHVDTSDWHEADSTGPSDFVIAHIVDAKHAGPLLVLGEGHGLLEQVLAWWGKRIAFNNL